MIYPYTMEREYSGRIQTLSPTMSLIVDRRINVTETDKRVAREISELYPHDFVIVSSSPIKSITGYTCRPSKTSNYFTHMFIFDLGKDMCYRVETYYRVVDLDRVKSYITQGISSIRSETTVVLTIQPLRIGRSNVDLLPYEEWARERIDSLGRSLLIED